MRGYTFGGVNINKQKVNKFIEEQYPTSEQKEVKDFLNLALMAGSRFYIILFLEMTMFCLIAYLFHSWALLVMSFILVLVAGYFLQKKKEESKLNFDVMVIKNPKLKETLKKLAPVVIEAQLLDNEIFKKIVD